MIRGSGRAVLFTVGLTAVVAVVCIFFGYILATLVNRLGRARPVVLGILLISYVSPQVVGAVAFSWLFDSNFGGIVDYLLNWSRVGPSATRCGSPPPGPTG